ncbi:MAG: toll/interleukin-1 receptor domain-containing protein [Cyclobacteriaceae bacterium]
MAKQEVYFSGKLRKAFPVADLLNGIEKPETRKVLKSCHIFVSYSHKDDDYKEKLLEHLMPLVRLNKASVWDDTSIDAGEEWREEIFSNLNKADVVLCLISSGFIASDFCYTKELKHALEAHNNGVKTVIPIRIREVNWSELPISEIQGLPGKWMSKIDDDKSWTEVSKGIEKAINRITRN